MSALWRMDWGKGKEGEELSKDREQLAGRSGLKEQDMF